MPDQIAHGEIGIELNDSSALTGMHALDAEMRATMAKIDRMQAEATVGANTTEIEAKLKKAKDKLRELRGMKATVRADANTEALDRKIKNAERAVKRLDGKKATIEINTRGGREAAANIERLTKLEAARAKAELRYAQQKQRLIDQDRKAYSDAEKAAAKQHDLMRKADLDAAKNEQRIASLRREFGRLDTDLDRISKRRRGLLIGEEKIKVDLDEQFIRSRMEALKKELEFIGGHPPIKLRARMDEPYLKRTFLNLRESVGNILNKVGNIGNIRLSLGPFSATLRTFTVAAAVLGPILTSLLGSVTALAGVLTTGLAGALAIGGGLLAGFVFNMGGVVASVIPAVKNLKQVTQAQKAYNTAVDKYGKGSKQAETAQKQLNSILKSSDPATRQAAKAVSGLGEEWRKLTGKTAERDLGRGITAGARALKTLMPTLARNSNQTFDILTHGWQRFTHALSSPGGIRTVDSLGKSFNSFLAPAMAGAQHLAAAFAHIAESAARLFGGKAGRGFDRWAADIDKATQPGEKLDHTIRRLGDDASDLLHFFAALGRLMITVLNGGSAAGDDLLGHMTHALDKWNEFLKTPQGQHDMANFFKEAADNTRALFNALAPLIGAFMQWTSAVTPWATAFLKGAAAVSKIVAEFTKLIGFSGAFSTLAASLGAIWAVGKLGAFVSMLAKAVTLMRELGAIGTGKMLLTGGLGQIFKRGGPSAAVTVGETAAGGAGASAFSKIFSRGSNTAAKSAAKAAGIGVGESAGGGILAGAATALSVSTAAIAGAGILGAVILMNAKSTAGEQAKKHAGATGASGAKAYQDAYQKYVDAHRPRIGAVPDWVKANANKVATAAAQQFTTTFSSQVEQGLTTAGGNAVATGLGNIRAQHNLDALQKGPKGAKLVSQVQLSGDANAMKTLATLARTKIGTKFLRIVAQGGDAALRQLMILANTKLGQKLMTIITHGGPQAQVLLQALDNKKMRQKIVDIVQQGGPKAQALLAALDNKKISSKQFKAILNDLATNKLNALRNLKLPNKQFTVLAQTTQAAANLSHIQSLLSSLHDRNVNVRTVYTQVQNFSKLSHPQGSSPGNAMGGPAIKMPLKSRDATARGAFVNRPTLLTGEEGPQHGEYVIATNPRYRRSNLAYLRAAARELGVEMALSGRMSKRGAVKRKLILSSAERIPEVDDYRKLQDAENVLESKVAVAERQVREPDSFLKKVGVDAAGDDVFDIDQPVVDKYRAEIQNVFNLQADLQGTIQKLANAYQPALQALSKYRDSLRTQMKTLRAAIAKDTRLTDSKDKDTAKAARKRLTKEKHELSLTEGNFTESSSTINDIGADNKDVLRNRLPLSREDMTDTRITLDALTGKVNDALASANPTPDKTGAGGDTGSSPTDQQQITNLTAALHVANTGRQVAEAFAQVAGGPGDIGGGFRSGRQAGMSGSDMAGGGATVNIYTLHPGDPATLRAVGDAATGGFGFQGTITSPRESVGY